MYTYIILNRPKLEDVRAAAALLCEEHTTAKPLGTPKSPLTGECMGIVFETPEPVAEDVRTTLGIVEWR